MGPEQGMAAQSDENNEQPLKRWTICACRWKPKKPGEAANFTVVRVVGRRSITGDQKVIQCHLLIADPPYGITKEPWEPEDLEAFTRQWCAHRSPTGTHKVRMPTWRPCRNTRNGC